MELETSSLVLLVVSCAVSFGLGRTFVHFRNRKRKVKALERQAQTLRDRPAEPESRNKSKRKRQLEEIKKAAAKRKPLT